MSCAVKTNDLPLLFRVLYFRSQATWGSICNPNTFCIFHSFPLAMQGNTAPGSFLNSKLSALLFCRVNIGFPGLLAPMKEQNVSVETLFAMSKS